MDQRSHQSGLYLIFAISGLSSLVYECLWVRLLALGVGSTSTALSFVLSIFFTGLAVGSLWGGKLALNNKNPLRSYAILEGLIGGIALLLYFPLAHFQELLALFPAFLTTGTSLTILKFSLVFLLLIIPTLAMGATFPLLTRVQQQLFGTDGLHRGNGIERLYAFNTVGAATGAFASSFLLIPLFGVFVSNGVAVALNFLLGAVAFWWSRRPEFSREVPEPAMSLKAHSSTTDKQPRLNPWQLAVLFSVAAVGFASITAQVVWNKYLGIFFGTNIYGLGLILSLFLAGIALGAFVLNVLLKTFKVNPAQLLVVLLGAALVAMLAVSRLLNLAPIAANFLTHIFAGALNMIQVKSILTAALIVFPTAIFGAIFPLAIRVASADLPVRQLPRVAGLIYALNTAGAVLASLLAGAYLVPVFGSAQTLRLAFLVMGLCALSVVLFIPGRARAQRIRQGLVLCAITIAAIGLGNVDFRNIIKAAYYQNLTGKEKLSDVLKVFDDDYEEFDLIIEGESAVISLSHDPSDGPDYKNYLRLKSNGLNESVYRIDRLEALPKYEALLGFLPYLFVRNPKSAFVVGYGGGCTADYLTRTLLKQVDVVELEAGVLAAADRVYKGNNPILKRPNLNLRIEDARFVLAASREKYDIIVSQPSHSWLSGVANLFTQEFFEIVRNRLSSKGVFSQWLNLYNIDHESLKSILRTFYATFPYGSVYTDKGDSQMIMIGSMNPLVLNLQKLTLLTQNDLLRSQLEYVPFTTPYDVLSNFSMGRTQVMSLVASAPLNTDDNAFAEVRQSSFFYRPEKDAGNAEEFLSQNFSADFSDILQHSDPENKKILLQGLERAYSSSAKADKLSVIEARIKNP